MSYDFGVYENLEGGADSVSFQREASRTALASAVYIVTQHFGSYLNNAYDKDDFNDRLATVKSDINDIVIEAASFDAIPEVIRVLTWNFDKKDDDDSSDDSDSEDDDSSDSDDDSDDDEDSTPDFVDTDKADDKDRDDKKESRRKRSHEDDEFGGAHYNYDDFRGNSGRGTLADDPRWSTHPDGQSAQPTDAAYDAWNKANPDLHAYQQKMREGTRRRTAEGLPEESEGFTGVLDDDQQLQASPVDADFDGSVNDLQPAGFNAVGKKIGATGYPIVARNVKGWGEKNSPGGSVQEAETGLRPGEKPGAGSLDHGPGADFNNADYWNQQANPALAGGVSLWHGASRILPTVPRRATAAGLDGFSQGSDGSYIHDSNPASPNYVTPGKGNPSSNYAPPGFSSDGSGNFVHDSNPSSPNYTGGGAAKPAANSPVNRASTPAQPGSGGDVRERLQRLVDDHPFIKEPDSVPNNQDPSISNYYKKMVNGPRGGDSFYPDELH